MSLTQSLERLASLHNVSMESSKIDNSTAKNLLKRMCKAISKSCGTIVTPNYYSNGEVNIVSDDNEIAMLKIPGKPTLEMYFESATHLLEVLLIPNTLLYFFPLGKEGIEIDVSAMFGTTIEEVKIKLDLLKM